MSIQVEGDSLAILKADLKSQRKQVRNLKKKSLWSRSLEEVMEKLVDIVHYLILEIHCAFGSNGGDVAVIPQSIGGGSNHIAALNVEPNTTPQNPPLITTVTPIMFRFHFFIYIYIEREREVVYLVCN
ncbi:uncharacterized protein [Gossypium hirsutum]|uniref:Uncharacterized protein isoform X2 n=1 Tax=Gossypium hirsutum TaxID=3635 RepID=A0ABM3AB55_GOSHI|nr:uncharacterized protein LOC107962364 isoform X2 [Gossypium hirsutum]